MKMTTYTIYRFVPKDRPTTHSIMEKVNSFFCIDKCMECIKMYEEREPEHSFFMEKRDIFNVRTVTYGEMENGAQ